MLEKCLGVNYRMGEFLNEFLKGVILRYLIITELSNLCLSCSLQNQPRIMPNVYNIASCEVFGSEQNILDLPLDMKKQVKCSHLLHKYSKVYLVHSAWCNDVAQDRERFRLQRVQSRTQCKSFHIIEKK